MTVNDTEFTIKYPKENASVSGIIFADPCIPGSAAGCLFGTKFQTQTRTPAMLNAATNRSSASGGVDYVMILGDNFYDRDGTLTRSFFSRTSVDFKSTVFATCAGNHDYWGLGTPILQRHKLDQYGNGHAQYYGMDAAASRGGSADFLDLSVDPDAEMEEEHNRIAAMSNFFTYFKLGNTAFILYSGAYSYSLSETLFEEACAWLAASKPKAAFLAGHWNVDDLGCEKDMDARPISFGE